MSTFAGSKGARGSLQRRKALNTALLLIFLLYSFLPLFYLIVSSTKSNANLFSSFGLWFASSFDLLSNLHKVFTFNGGIYLRWLLNTAYYSVISAVGATFLATMAGYVFAKFHFRGRTLLFALILGAIMIPQTALAIPLYLLLSKIGLVNTPFAVILPSLVFPFGVYLMRVYAEQSVPDELLEAARIDGAGEFRIFFRVVLRILAPGFVTVLLFSFVFTWNNYFLPLIVLNDPRLYTITVGLAAWNSQASAAGGGSQALFPLVITGGLVGIIPIIAAFLFLQRYWQGGLTFGSLK